MPFVMKWPRKIPGGVVFEPPVSALDIFPTAYVAAGGVPRENMQLDGVDLLPYLQGSKKLPPHENLFWRAGSIWAVREDTWKLIYAADRYWLFDLKADVGEQNNMADIRPGREHIIPTVAELNHFVSTYEELWPETFLPGANGPSPESLESARRRAEPKL